MASESRPCRPFALYAAHLPASEADAPTAAAWGWCSLPLPDAEPEGWPAAAQEALRGIEVTTLQVAPTTPPTNLTFEAVVLHRCAGLATGGHPCKPSPCLLRCAHAAGAAGPRPGHLPPKPLAAPAPRAALCAAPRSGPGPRPTVITPHGGPHTAYSAGYFAAHSYLVALG